MPKIYSYRRVSTIKQQSGVSLEVQSDKETLKELSAKYSLPVSDKSYSDVGKSAYKGEHLNNELGFFLEDLSCNRVARGSILVVYSLDRLSRQNLGFANQVYLDITNNGVSIYSILDSHLYKAHNAADAIISTIIFERANNESKTKGQRSNSTALKVIGSHLEGKRTSDNYAYQVAFGNNPWWITNRKDGAVIEHPKYWDIAKQLYQRIINGDGNTKVLTWLNENFPAPKTRTKNKTASRMSEWKFSMIANFHKQEALHGQKTVTVYKNKPEQKIYTLDSYFPALITKTEWYTLQSIKKKRRTADSTRKRYSLITGMGIAKCYLCGAIVVSATDVTKDGTRTRYICAGRRNLQNGCAGFGFKALWVEKAMFALSKGTIFTPSQRDETKLLSMQGELEQDKSKMNKIKSLFLDDPDMMEELGSQLKTLRKQITILEESIIVEQQLLSTEQPLDPNYWASLNYDWELLSIEALDEENKEIRKVTRELIRNTFSIIEIGKTMSGQPICKFTRVDGNVGYAVHNSRRDKNERIVKLTKMDQGLYDQIKEFQPELIEVCFVDENEIKVNFDNVPDFLLLPLTEY